MIKANMTKTGFIIEGHANFAPHGYDIICAGVSTLVFTFLRCVDPLSSVLDNGIVKCEFQLHDDEFTHYDFLITGLEMIAEQYPDYLEVNTWR